MTVLYTIGHSTHTMEEFIEILNTYHIALLIDIRSIPKSRHVPWFNADILKTALHKHQIHYRHFPLLGGLRHTSKQSINTAWQNTSFRGYADYMQTKDFFNGLKALNAFIKLKKRVVIMCAEVVPWRCHRSLVADAEVVRGIQVIHIMSLTSAYEHKITPFADVDRKRRPIKICYPGKDMKRS